MLEESPERGGFVDDAQFNALLPNLRPDIRCIVSIGYRLGWRVRSEVLTLEKSQLDLEAGTVRLNPGKTKNKEGYWAQEPSGGRRRYASRSTSEVAGRRRLALSTPAHTMRSPETLPFPFGA